MPSETARMTPEEAAAEIGVKGETVRSWLRADYQNGTQRFPWGFAFPSKEGTSLSYIIIRNALIHWLNFGTQNAITQIVVGQEHFDTLAKAIISR